QDDAFHGGAVRSMNFFVSRIGADGSITGRIGPEEDAIRVALVISNVRANPFDDASDVFCRLVPSKTASATTLHIYTCHTVLHRPPHDVVVEGFAVRYLHLPVSPTARHIHQHRPLLPPPLPRH